MSELRSFALDDIREVMRACAGVGESVDLDRDIGDVTFQDLGYDSLAVLEIAAKLQNRLDVVIPDNAVENLLTPRLVIEHVNAMLERTINDASSVRK